MAKKNFNAEELNEPTGPMNSAAKEDALVWAGATSKAFKQTTAKSKKTSTC